MKLADGTWIMDSRQIADAIEKSHPEPSVHLDSPYLSKVGDILSKIFEHVRSICYSRIPVNLLNETSVQYWYDTRKERLGMSVQDFEQKYGGEAAYKAAEPHLKQMTDLLRERDGLFFMGTEPSYADFVWVGALVFFKRVDTEVFKEVLRRTGDRAVHESLLDACAPWLKRDSY